MANVNHSPGKNETPPDDEVSDSGFPLWWKIIFTALPLLIIVMVAYTFFDVTKFERRTKTPGVVDELFSLVFSNWEYDQEQVRDFIANNFVLDKGQSSSSVAKEFLSIRYDNTEYATPSYSVVEQRDGYCEFVPVLADKTKEVDAFVLIYNLDVEGRINGYTLGVLKDVEKENTSDVSDLLEND